MALGRLYHHAATFRLDRNRRFVDYGRLGWQHALKFHAQTNGHLEITDGTAHHLYAHLQYERAREVPPLSQAGVTLSS